MLADDLVFTCERGYAYSRLETVARIVRSCLSLCLLDSHLTLFSLLLAILLLCSDEDLFALLCHLKLKLLCSCALSYHYFLSYTVSAEEDVGEYSLGVSILNKFNAYFVKRQLYTHYLTLVNVFGVGKESVRYSAAICRLVGYLVKARHIVLLGWEMRYYLKALRIVESTAFVLYLVESLRVAVLVEAEFNLNSHRRLSISEFGVRRTFKQSPLVL